MRQNNSMTSSLRCLSICLLVGLIPAVNAISGHPVSGQTPAPAQPSERVAPPTRDPDTAGFVSAKQLPDGSNPPVNADGNFILGPTHEVHIDAAAPDGSPTGTVIEFTLNSSDSKIYPGIGRNAGTFGTPDPADPAKLVVTTSHPAAYTRKVAVYVPKQYVAGSVAPFMVGADGPDPALFTALDNLIAQHRAPAMIAISISTGSGARPGKARAL